MRLIRERLRTKNSMRPWCSPRLSASIRGQKDVLRGPTALLSSDCFGGRQAATATHHHCPAVAVSPRPARQNGHSCRNGTLFARLSISVSTSLCRSRCDRRLCRILPNPVISSRLSSRSDEIAPEPLSPILNPAILSFPCTPPHCSTKYFIVL